MNKSIYALAIALVLGTTTALATPGGEPNNTGCNGVGNPNSPCEGQGGNGGNGGNGGSGGSGGDGGNAINTSTNTNTNTAGATSNSGANASNTTSVVVDGHTFNLGMGTPTTTSSSGGSANAQGGAGGNSKSHATGGAGGDSSSQSQVGDTIATSGDSVSSASNGGNTTGDVAVSIEGDTYVERNDYSKLPSSGAASVYSQVCQNGGSAQARAGGFSVNNQDVVCEHLKIAAVMREAFIFELQYGEKTDCFVDRGGMTNCQVSDKAVEYNKAYHEHMTEAIQAMEAYEEVGLADKMAGALIRPLALIGALIWLI